MRLMDVAFTKGEWSLREEEDKGVIDRLCPLSLSECASRDMNRIEPDDVRNICRGFNGIICTWYFDGLSKS